MFNLLSDDGEPMSKEHIFISHSSKDDDFVRELGKSLEIHA
jgi:hypothetical protein